MLPHEISLRNNRDATVAVIQQIRRTVLHEHRGVVLYFDKVEKLEPAATILLAAELYRCRHLRPGRDKSRSVTGNYPTDPQVYAELCDMGFFKLLEVREKNDVPKGVLLDTRPLFLPMHSLTIVEPGLAARFCELVSRGAFELSDLARGRMVAALKEAMGNANEHAYVRPGEFPVMSRRWWIAGHLDPLNREMMLVILDQGIGIPNRLEPTTFEQINAMMGLSWAPSDGTMIAAATELYRSSTGEGGRGKGFQDMKRFVATCDDGELRVMSNRGSYIYTKDKELIDDHDTSIGGTLVEWRVRHSAIAEFSDG